METFVNGSAGEHLNGVAKTYLFLDVKLIEAGHKRIYLTKALRELLGLDLRAAKALVDAAPVTIKEMVKADEAHEIQSKLEAVDASIELVAHPVLEAKAPAAVAPPAPTAASAPPPRRKPEPKAKLKLKVYERLRLARNDFAIAHLEECRKASVQERTFDELGEGNPVTRHATKLLHAATARAKAAAARLIAVMHEAAEANGGPELLALLDAANNIASWQRHGVLGDQWGCLLIKGQFEGVLESIGYADGAIRLTMDARYQAPPVEIIVRAVRERGLAGRSTN